MDYPKMMFRDGEASDHISWDGPVLVAGEKVETLIVNDEDEELAAMGEGWRLTAAAPDEAKREKVSKVTA